MHKLTKKTLAAAAVTMLLISGGGVAYAYWTAGGSGNGTAATGTNVPITAVQMSVIGDMAPGVAPKALKGNFNNSNAGAVHVERVTPSIASVTTAVGAVGTCTAADYTLVIPTKTNPQEVPSGTGVGEWAGGTIAFNSTDANQDGCKGATVNLTYVIS